MNPKFLVNQLIQVRPGSDHIATKRGRHFVLHAECETNRFVGFPGEKGDLAFVIFPVVEKTVASQAASGNTFQLRHLYNRIFGGGLTVAPEEIMTRRNVEPANFHASRLYDACGRFHDVGIIHDVPSYWIRKQIRLSGLHTARRDDSPSLLPTHLVAARFWIRFMAVQDRRRAGAKSDQRRLIGDGVLNIDSPLFGNEYLRSEGAGGS
ncbi:MAG TPA: hypothetical protein VNN22_06455 [Verrucomicrobiae bacterium]|nr:hypothetical protein [Verrucomicrobiae bacterium]